MELLTSTTDYINKYIEKHFYKADIDNDNNIDINYDFNYKNYEPEIFSCLMQIHNHPNKEEICKNWDYGEEFLLISKRHENGKSFYYAWNKWEESFMCDLELQIKCISKPRNKIDNKKILDYVMPINKILRIDYECCMHGSPNKWEEDLGIYFQKIIDATIEEKNEIFDIWNDSYAKSFKLAQIDHSSGKKDYFYNYPESSFMCSFITSFMMYQYH
jgi:hypothetical protein